MQKCLLLIVLFAVVLVGCGQTTAEPTATAAPTIVVGRAEQGRVLFAKGIQDAPPCSSCHPVNPGGFALGPAMSGVAKRAATRREGMTAEAYLHESIVEPTAYIVSGYRPIMYPQYAAHLTEQDVADLVAYLLTLK